MFFISVEILIIVFNDKNTELIVKTHSIAYEICKKSGRVNSIIIPFGKLFGCERLIMVNYMSKMSVISLIYYNFATEKKHHNIVAILGLMKFYALIHYLKD